MSSEVVAILQNSLTENERIRKRQLAAFGFAFLAMLGVLFWIGHLAEASTDVRTVLVWSVLAMVVAVVTACWPWRSISIAQRPAC